MSNSGKSVFEQADLCKTLASRTVVLKNRNLLYWYRLLYERVLGEKAVMAKGNILEIGSGASPLKLFFPQCLSSDVLDLEHVDHVFDCHEIDTYEAIPDHSIDIMLLVNVLHHLHDPIDFLKRAHGKIASNGELIIVEPYFSALSSPIFKYLHHEPVDFSIAQPKLDTGKGPLSSANQALPYMLFFSRPDWINQLKDSYDLSRMSISHYSWMSYFVSGGVSRIIHLPHFLYKAFHSADCFMANIAPDLFASFFITKLSPRTKT